MLAVIFIVAFKCGRRIWSIVVFIVGCQTTQCPAIYKASIFIVRVPFFGGWTAASPVQLRFLGSIYLLQQTPKRVLADGVTYSFGVLFVEFLDIFKAGNGATSWIGSILVGVTLCSGPVSSYFVNKYGCRAVTIAGSVLASACLALSVFATGVVTLYFSIGAGAGLGFGLIYLPAIVSVTCYFEKYRSLATGIAVCGSGLGTFIFAPLIDCLIKELGWRGTLLVVAAFVLSCAAMGALFRPLEAPVELVVVSPAAGDQRASLRASERDLLDASRPRTDAHFTTIPRASRPAAARMALSQPMLLGSAFGSQSLAHKGSGLMDRKDILYTGSLHNLSRHRSTPWLTELPEEDQLVDNAPKKALLCGALRLSAASRRTLADNASLLVDPIFAVFTASNFLTSIGFNMPYVYIVAQAEQRGVTTKDASYLLSIIGGANLLGRVVLGYLSDKEWVDRLAVYNVCLTVCGLATVFSAFCDGFVSLSLYAAVFGFTIGAYVGLTSVILVDLLGLDRLTNAFGLLLLFQGIASLIGPPIGGFLFDYLQSYNYAFYVAGTAIAVSGLMLFSIPPLQRRRLSAAV